MTESSANKSGKTGLSSISAAEREARRAEQLRENLRKRKEQARARVENPPDSPPSGERKN